MLAEIVNDNDVAMAKLAGCAGLVAESHEELRIAGREQDLDGYLAADNGVMGTEDAAEPARSQFGLQFISPNSARHCEENRVPATDRNHRSSY